MEFSYRQIKEYLKNVYFINGTAYAGKSTACKILSEQYNLVLVGENHKYNDYLAMTNPTSHPHMNYFKTMSGWEEFVTRDKEDYEAWMKGVSNELVPFEIMELISISKDKKVIAETNIPHHILVEIADPDHIAYMVSTTEIAMDYFFEREDKEKNFLLDVIHKTQDSEGNLERYKETIAYLNRQEVIDGYLQSGIFCIQRLNVREDIQEKVDLLAIHFGLK
jgi:hypothetical protein